MTFLGNVIIYNVNVNKYFAKLLKFLIRLHNIFIKDFQLSLILLYSWVFSNIILFLLYRQLYADEIKTCFSIELDPGIYLENDSSLVASVLSNLIKLPIVIIESGMERYVRPFLPTVDLVSAESIIYLAHNVEINWYFNTGHKDITSGTVII